jgi:hypothetical protein
MSQSGIAAEVGLSQVQVARVQRPCLTRRRDHLLAEGRL